MGGGSWKVPRGGETDQRIRLAFHRGDITWEDLPFGWLRKYVDRAIAKKQTFDNAVRAYVAAGGEITAQRSPPNGEYDHDPWYYVIVEVSDREYFYKFALHPDDPEVPQILVLNLHYQLSS